MTQSAERERLAILVHEVRSPVAALAAIADAYPSAHERGERESLLRFAVSAARALERLVLDGTVASVRIEQVDLEALIRGAAATAEMHGARIDVRASGELERVSGDPVRLRQTLDNLISNARIHAPECRIALSLDARDDAVLISVADEGPGIPVEEHERIFEPGARLDEGRPGSGLGLAIARAVALAHGGELTVASSPGRGATFTLVLPRTRGVR